MSTRVITWKGTPIGVTAVTIGVTRTDTSAVVVVAGTAMALVSAGVYNYSFTEPALNIIYSVAINWTFVNGTSDSITYLTAGANSSTGRYASQADLESRYGTSNIAAWSNPDGSAAGTAAIQSRIVDELLYADAVIDGIFSGSSYIVPLVLGVSGTRIVRRWAVTIAGNSLYHNRGQREEGEKDNQYATELASAMQQMRDFLDPQANAILDAQFLFSTTATGPTFAA